MKAVSQVSSRTWQGIENCQTCVAVIGFVYAPLLIVAVAATLVF